MLYVLENPSGDAFASDYVTLAQKNSNKFVFSFVYSYLCAIKYK